MAGNKGIVPVGFYRFSAANKTITFSNDYAGLDLGEITYITNIKNGVATVIYDPFDATKGGTLSGLTLTLAYNTTTMADTDPLQIITGFTPVNADPLPVRLVEGPDEKDDTDLLNRIADGIDYLGLSLDQSEGIQVNTRDISIKKDTQGAIIPSDAPNVIPISLVGTAINNISNIIDTTGYNSTIIQFKVPGTWGASVLTEGSNDGAAWFPFSFMYQSSIAASPLQVAGAAVQYSAGSDNTLIIPNYHKFIRLRVTLAGALATGPLTGTAYLRTIPVTATSAIAYPNMNLSFINGTAPLSNLLGSNSSFALVQNPGGLQVGSGFTPTFNQPNAATVLATTVPYPFAIGGREWPYMGALSGVFRYFTLDARGNLLLGGDTAFRTPNMGGVLEQSQAGTTRGIGGVFNNIQGAQSLTTADTNQDFGDTQTMLLRQILTELKILNQQFAEMPNIMNNPSYELSEPQEFRNDPTFDANN